MAALVGDDDGDGLAVLGHGQRPHPVKVDRSWFEVVSQGVKVRAEAGAGGGGGARSRGPPEAVANLELLDLAAGPVGGGGHDGLLVQAELELWCDVVVCSKVAAAAAA